MIGRKRDLLQAFRHPRGLAFGAVFAGLALATVAAVQLALPGGTALAGHNDVACDESVPAGWSWQVAEQQALLAAATSHGSPESTMPLPHLAR